jgi:hypothetical protein
MMLDAAVKLTAPMLLSARVTGRLAGVKVVAAELAETV